MDDNLYPQRVYEDGLKDHTLKYQRCESCAKAVFYPRVLCPHCGSVDLVWRTSAGQGTVYTSTTIMRRHDSYNVSLIDLDEGFRMMSRVEGHPEIEIPIGLAVKCAWRSVDDNEQDLLVFEPSEVLQ